MSDITIINLPSEEEEEDVCYYCYEEASTENPFAVTPKPCLCRGSICIHRSCLQEILTRTNNCGICKAPYNAFYRCQLNADGSIEEVKRGILHRYFVNDAGEYHGAYRTYHLDNETIYEEKTFSNGILHGTYIRYAANGQVKATVIYENGEKDGIEVAYHDNGILAVETNYSNGLKHGLQRVWHNNGQMSEEKHYEADYEHGLCKRWFQDGTLHLETDYVDGEIYGTSTSWYETGQMRIRAEYKNGRSDGLVEKWYENGVLHERYTNVGGAYDGLKEEWYSNGQLRISCVFEMGVPSGPCKTYYDNGVLASEGNVNGRLCGSHWGDRDNEYFMQSLYIEPTLRDGPWIENYQNGAQKKAETYVDGKLHGRHRIFHKNGLLKEEVKYVNGQKHGAFEKWYCNGKVEILSHYANGRLTRKPLNYNRNGALIV